MLYESINDITGSFSPAQIHPSKSGSRTLAELCGFNRKDRLLIINADDYGLCESTNSAIKDLFLAGEIDSISLIAGALGSDFGIEIIKEHDIPAGAHLTLTSEWENRILQPILPPDKIPSLLNGTGGFYSEIKQLYLTANNPEVESECRAQIESILERGIGIDHLDTHMGALQLRPDFVEIYLKLAGEYKLPMRMGSAALAEIMGMPPEQLKTAREAGFIFPDNLIYIPMSFTSEKDTRFEAYDFAIRNILSGISEIYFHPTYNGADFQSLQHEYSRRKNISYEEIRLWDYEYISSGRMRRIIEEQGLIRINYCKLRELTA